MIIRMPDTTTAAVESKLIELKQNGNAVALGRVLTLVILNDQSDPTTVSQVVSTSSTNEGGSTTDHHTGAETAITAANQASREHPARILALTGAPGEQPALDAELRIGGDAGASEVVALKLSGLLREQSEAVITPLLVPDAPIVAWWPGHAPQSPAQDPVGKVAALRITDSNHCKHGRAVLNRLAENYQPGDTDLGWTRLTGWRAQIAAALDLPPFEKVTKATVFGVKDRASSWLLAGWLAVELKCPTEFIAVKGAQGITGVILERPSGKIEFHRPDGKTLAISQPGFPPRHIALPLTSLSEALTEELRRLDADRVYEKVLTEGLDLVTTHDSGLPADTTTLVAIPTAEAGEDNE